MSIFSKGLVLSVITLFSFSPASYALETGDFSMDFRIINIAPNDSSSNIFAAGTAVAGTGVEVDSQVTLDVSFNYMVTNNLALELLADIPTTHNISANGLGSLSVPNGTDIIEASLLPPTLFLQYQFTPKQAIRPYAGIGVNYTLFFDESLTGAAKTALAATNLRLDNSFGVAAQAGVDYDLSHGWTISADLKYIKLNTTAKFTTALGATQVDVDIDPWVFGIGVSRTF